jgi:hypothetical protein
MSGRIVTLFLIRAKSIIHECQALLAHDRVELQRYVASKPADNRQG